MFRTGVLVAAALAMGLMAGLFTAFAYAIMPALSRGDDRTFVGAMQSINATILNGWFFLGFVGALVLSALAAVLHLGRGSRAALPWILAGLVLYASGSKPPGSAGTSSARWRRPPCWAASPGRSSSAAASPRDAGATGVAAARWVAAGGA